MNYTIKELDQLWVEHVAALPLSMRVLLKAYNINPNQAFDYSAKNKTFHVLDVLRIVNESTSIQEENLLRDGECLPFRCVSLDPPMSILTRWFKITNPLELSLCAQNPHTLTDSELYQVRSILLHAPS